MLLYTRLSVTILITVVYFAIFAGVLLSDSLPEVSEDTLGLDLNEAWANLHEIASQPHPYNSHANDLVRGYILNWLKNVTEGFPHVQIVDDLTSNGTWADFSIIEQAVQGVSFEGNNILVKVDGTDPAFTDQGGVLFSAHFDSVSTAPGATDNAMAVVTVMELVKLFTTTRTKRTAIFNINNGEEDGLKGAQVFMQHPWSSIPDTFFNLEGAGAGGHPTLFRATSKAPVLSFANPNVLHPYGTVLSADAFARKVVRSRTDYSVYELGQGDGSKGMEGLDFAYYQGRSKYHTKYDSIPGTKGGKRSLWSMMESVRGVGLALLNQDETHVGPSEQPVLAVYFDAFGRLFVVATQDTLMLLNTLLLALGPAIILAGRFLPRRTEEPQPRDGWRGPNFWVALLLGLFLQVALASSFLKLNPFIVYSQPFIVLASHLTLAYLTILFILQFRMTNNYSDRYAEKDKLAILLQLYVFTWILHAIGTYGLNKLALGGVYFLTAWNFFTFLGYLVAFSEMWRSFGALEAPSGRSTAEGDVRAGPSSSHQETDSVPSNERTPLLSQSSSSEAGPHHMVKGSKSQGWWIVQLLLIIPGPVLLLSQILLLLIQALHQTLADGSSPIVVYGAISLLSFFIMLPIAPFSTKIHHWLISVMSLIFLVSTVYSWTAFPFSKEEPLKVFFQQKVEIDLSSSASSGPGNEVLRAITSLSGASEFIGKMVVPTLPSSWGSDIHCVPALGTLSTCSWETSLLPSPVHNDPEPPLHQWLSVNATRTSPTSAFFSIKGTNTRSCRIYFDNRLIKTFNVHEVLPGGRTMPSAENMRKPFPIPQEGVNVLTLWSRTWDRIFGVEVHWDNTRAVANVTTDDSELAASSGLSGRVACEWAEYESATRGLNGLQRNLTGMIPAFEEVLMYLPEWTVPTKISDGLVEAFGRFTI